MWGIDFMGPFPSSCNKKFILVAVDYVGRGDTVSFGGFKGSPAAVQEGDFSSLRSTKGSHKRS